MERKGMKILVIVALVFFFGGCATPDPGGDPGLNPKVSTLTSSAPKSLKPSPEDQEAAIRQAFSGVEEDWNSRNTEAILSRIAPDAEIMVGRNRDIVSKEEFRKRLPATFDIGTIRTHSRSIKIIDENMAEVSSTVSYSETPYVWFKRKVLLVRSGKKWLIKKSTFTTYFRGEDPREKRMGGEELESYFKSMAVASASVCLIKLIETEDK